MGPEDKTHNNGNGSHVDETDSNTPGSTDVSKFDKQLERKDEKPTKSSTDDEVTDEDSIEGQKKKIKYPKSVFFIISNEFCERFNYYGMRTVLVLYLSRNLGYGEDTSTVIFHIFTMFVYFLCIFGAILADSWLGKFRTILYLSIVYVAGSVLITLGAIPPLNLPQIAFTMIGLALIALGSGGIKPCVAAFGGDQFKMPEQLKQVATFFSLFYFSINAGSLISTTVTPILREDVHCFGQLECFSLAFGVPAVLMALSIIIFVLGKPLYKTRPPGGNMLVLVSKTIGNAISTRWKEKKTAPREHWLDYADTKYGKQMVADTKVLLRVLVLYIPLPIFWSLFDQQGSRWTFQATRMDGDMGSFNIKPDQLQMLNPLLILAFIPLYEALFYPLLAKIGIRRPLQKLALGGIFAGVAFVISGVIELSLEKTYPVLPRPGHSQVRIFNGVAGCDYTVKTNLPGHEQFILKSLEMFEEKFVETSKGINLDYEITSDQGGCFQMNGVWTLEDGKANSFFLHKDDTSLVSLDYIDEVDKPSRGSPMMRMLATLRTPENIIWKEEKKGSVRYDREYSNYTLTELTTSPYIVYAGTREIFRTQLRQGGVYTILVAETDTDIIHKIIEITEPNSMNIFWLVPQYFIMTLGEVMYSVTGLEFSYAQAPNTMKSVLQACWLLTVAFGNVIDVIIVELKLFDSQAYEFFLFAGLMFADMIVFMFMAWRYKPNNPLELVEDSEQSEDNTTDEETLDVKPSALEFKPHQNGNSSDGGENEKNEPTPVAISSVPTLEETEEVNEPIVAPEPVVSESTPEPKSASVVEEPQGPAQTKDVPEATKPTSSEPIVAPVAVEAPKEPEPVKPTETNKSDKDVSSSPTAQHEAEVETMEVPFNPFDKPNFTPQARTDI